MPGEFVVGRGRRKAAKLAAGGKPLPSPTVAGTVGAFLAPSLAMDIRTVTRKCASTGLDVWLQSAPLFLDGGELAGGGGMKSSGNDDGVLVERGEDLVARRAQRGAASVPRPRSPQLLGAGPQPRAITDWRPAASTALAG